jgi:glycosyltransferase involved in cell wall biosynthesis
VLILHVVAPAEFGGLERVIQLLGTGLQEAGHEVHVACIVSHAVIADPLLAPLSAAGVQTHQIVVSGRGYARERAAVAELCRRLRPDVVHTHGYRPDVVDAGVARELGIATVTTAHGFTGGPWRNRLYEYLQRRAFRRFDAVIAVSRPLGERLAASGVARDRLHVVPNAYRRLTPPLDRTAARRELGLPVDEFVVGWVGRLSQEKGPDVLVDALPLLRDVPLAISFVGTGVQSEWLEARAEQQKVGERVRWHGVVPDAGRLFPAFDLCVLSSRTEGTPVVLFEAMAAGVPVVTTAVGGVPDVVSADEALLVPSEDSRALAAAIRDVYTQPAAAAQRARAARARLAREFGTGPWIDRYVDIYRRVRREARIASGAAA